MSDLVTGVRVKLNSPCWLLENWGDWYGPKLTQPTGSEGLITGVDPSQPKKVFVDFDNGYRGIVFKNMLLKGD